MKAIPKFPVLVALLLGINLCQAQQAITSQSSAPPPTAWSATIIDGNSTSWQRTEYKQDPNGNIITNTSSYTELASGLNHLVGNQYVPSSEDIVMLPDGSCMATNAQCQVFLPSDIYNGEIKMVTPDGIQLQSRPVGLLLADSTNSLFIAVLTNSTGELISSNQVIFPSAFEGLDADLLYTVTKSGLEQDVIIRASPPSPAASGLDSATTRLQLMTEFFNPPQPVVTAMPLPNQGGLTLTDDTLDFGAMKMMQGRAFLLGTDARDSGVFVSKSWVQIAGRQFLVERIPFAAFADQLTTLPQGTAKVGTLPNLASLQLKLPPQHLAKASPSVRFRQVRLKTLPSKGLVMDYQTVSGAITNYDFQGDTTYYISGQVNLYGTNTFEGGCVLKYATNTTVSLESSSSINWQASDYLPVIMTAKDDNTEGETISGSTGSPTGYYGSPALSVVNSVDISYFRIAYAQLAISARGPTDSFENGQIVDCQNGIYAEVATTVNLGNLLFDNVQTDLYNLTYVDNIDAQNSTFDLSSNLTSTMGSYQTVLPYFTNCIFVNIRQLTNNPNEYGLTYGVGGGNNGFYDAPEFGVSAVSNTFYPFQTVGGGSYYLTNGCAFIDAGTTNIGGSLLADLAAKTVYPPVVFSNVSISIPTTLSPQVQRDNTGNPDLGYHYDTLDYAFGACSLYTNMQVTAGTAIGLYGIYGQPCGILLNNGANFTATGTATAPCWIAFANSVQEGCNGQWIDSQRPPAFQFNGSGSGEPQINTTFAKMYDGGFNNALVTDGHEQGECNFQNSEFWMGGFAPYDEQFLNFSNCFFFRPQVYFWDQSDNPNITFQDCTFYGGILFIARDANGNNYPPSIVTVENTAFDGTAFPWSDPLNSNTNYTIENYNAYNTNNLSWQSYSYPYGPCYGTLQTLGSHSVYVTNYNWGSSWFGNYYLPADSPLIQAGSTNAYSLDLYNFTTQTNQVPETNATVDIGYHYLATDADGNPLTGTNSWWLVPPFITQPLVNQQGMAGDSAAFNVTAVGTSPTYQWTYNGTTITGQNSPTLNLNNIQAATAGTYAVKVSNPAGSADSSANLAVLLAPSIHYPNVRFTVAGAPADIQYDLYFAPALGQAHSFRIFYRGSHGQTAFTCPLPSTSDGFFEIGQASDTDGDGLTDGYEELVSGSSPTLPDSDQDPMPDGWEVAWGTNPNVDDASDQGADGLTYLQSYEQGADPFRTAQTPRPVVVASPLNGANGAYVITRTGSTSSSLSVNYTVGGTAVYGSDYTISGAGSTYPLSVTIPANASSVTITPSSMPDGKTFLLAVIPYSLYDVPNPANWTYVAAPGDTYGDTDGNGLADAMAASFGLIPAIYDLDSNGSPEWRSDSTGDGLPDSYKFMVGVSLTTLESAPSSAPANPLPTSP